MKPKPENPVIAIQTFKTSLDRLGLPATVNQVGSLLNITRYAVAARVSAARSIEFQVEIDLQGAASVFESVGGEKVMVQVAPEFKTADAGKKIPVPILTAPSLPDALVGIIYSVVSDVIAESNRFEVEKFINQSGQSHSVFCENCRNLVERAKYGKTACLQCESEQ